MKFRLLISFVVAGGVAWANAIAPGGSGLDMLQFDGLSVQSDVEYWSLLSLGQDWLVPGVLSSFGFDDPKSPSDPGSFSYSVDSWASVELWDRGTAEPILDAPGETPYPILTSDSGHPGLL